MLLFLFEEAVPLTLAVLQLCSVPSLLSRNLKDSRTQEALFSMGPWLPSPPRFWSTPIRCPGCRLLLTHALVAHPVAFHLASAWPEKVIAPSRDRVHPAKNPQALEGGAQHSLARPPEPLSGLWERCSRAREHVPLLHAAVHWTAGRAGQHRRGQSSLPITEANLLQASRHSLGRELEPGPCCLRKPERSFLSKRILLIKMNTYKTFIQAGGR